MGSGIVIAFQPSLDGTKIHHFGNDLWIVVQFQASLLYVWYDRNQRKKEIKKERKEIVMSAWEREREEYIWKRNNKCANLPNLPALEMVHYHFDSTRNWEFWTFSWWVLLDLELEPYWDFLLLLLLFWARKYSKFNWSLHTATEEVSLLWLRMGGISVDLRTVLYNAVLDPNPWFIIGIWRHAVTPPPIEEVAGSLSNYLYDGWEKSMCAAKRNKPRMGVYSTVCYTVLFCMDAHQPLYYF